MKKKVIPLIVLSLIFIFPSALRAETSTKDASPETEVKGTAYDEAALTMLPGAPKLDSARGTFVPAQAPAPVPGEQARRSDDLGQSSTVTEVKAPAPKEKPAETKAVETLKPSPLGQPGTYKIILAKTGPYEGELALDLGFSVYFRLSEVAEDLSEFKEGELVAFEEKEIQLLGKPRGANSEDLLYTYKARVVRVLDGDTLEAGVDLGFGITTTQTLRLRGIDCPELVTKEGKEAKAFVEGLLKPSSEVLIKTSKSDKYDRYLADIFITDKTGDVHYLNNELLKKGLAVRVSE